MDLKVLSLIGKPTISSNINDLVLQNLALYLIKSDFLVLSSSVLILQMRSYSNILIRYGCFL